MTRACVMRPREPAMDQRTYVLSFEGASTADANRYAAELRELLLDADPTVRAAQRRDRPETQDFGATLVLVLGAPAAVAVAKGIESWLAKRNTARLTVTTDTGQVILENVGARDAAAIIDKFLNSQ